MIDYTPPIYDQPPEDPPSAYEYVVVLGDRYEKLSSDEEPIIKNQTASFDKKKNPFNRPNRRPRRKPKSEETTSDTIVVNDDESVVQPNLRLPEEDTTVLREDVESPSTREGEEGPTLRDSPSSLDIGKRLYRDARPTLPSESDLLDCAKEIKELFDDGFQWHDLGSIISMSIDFIDDFLDLSLEQRRKCVTKILNHLIDITDTPYLPDIFTDSLFKSMIPPFVDLMLPESFDSLFPTPSASCPRESEISLATRTILETFENGFQWEDLAIVTQMAIKFAANYEDINRDEKANIAKTIVNKVIDWTDTPYLPDCFVDGIFKDLAAGIIDELFSIF